MTSELKVNVTNLDGGNLGSASSNLESGNISQQSVNLDGGEVTEQVDIVLEGGKMDMQTGNIRGKPLQFGITNLAMRAGKDGKSAYQAAKEGGYIGTETEFNKLLANMGVIDNLDSKDEEKALSANQGRILNEKLEVIRCWHNLDENN